jgi:hypothetical protein
MGRGPWALLRLVNTGSGGLCRLKSVGLGIRPAGHTGMRRGGPTIAVSAPLVVARTRHLQQFAHPLDRVAGLLRFDHPVGFHRLCSQAKKAAAFFQNSWSKRNSAFSRRGRSTSARSPAASTARVSLAREPWRWRPTHRRRICPSTLISAAT